MIIKGRSLIKPQVEEPVTEEKQESAEEKRHEKDAAAEVKSDVQKELTAQKNKTIKEEEKSENKKEVLPEEKEETSEPKETKELKEKKEERGEKKEESEAVKPEPEVAEEKPVKPVRKPRTKKVDLDLSLDDIKFDQRSERREGTRRRGYRRTQDRNLVSRAQQDALSIKEAAKQEGYNEGVANAKKDLDELKEKLSDFYKLKDDVFNKVSDCIYDISVEMAKKILNKEVENLKEYVIPMIKAAIEEVSPTENKITLKVMPKDVEIVKDKLPEIFSGSGIEASISVIPDKNITAGGVIVATSNGIIDATIETQMIIMEKTLLNAKGE